MADRLILKRIETGDQGTFGHLTAGHLTLFTGELPWRDNQQNISCIPDGLFECRWTWSARFRRYMYEVIVPGRVGVRIHSANYVGDPTLGLRCQLHGCIALGEKLGWMEKQKALLLSKPAVRNFETLMGMKPFELEIINECV